MVTSKSLEKVLKTDPGMLWNFKGSRKFNPACLSYLYPGRGRGDGGFIRQTSYEDTRGEGGGGFGRGTDARRQGWSENRYM